MNQDARNHRGLHVIPSVGRAASLPALNRINVVIKTNTTSRASFPKIPSCQNREATLDSVPVSETTQPVSAFGRKVKKKDPGASALMALGIAGIVACVIAIALVFTSMGGL
jgi:hypothetical protein